MEVECRGQRYDGQITKNIELGRKDCRIQKSYRERNQAENQDQADKLREAFRKILENLGPRVLNNPNSQMT